MPRSTTSSPRAPSSQTPKKASKKTLKQAPNKTPPRAYHHGDLRQALLEAATRLVADAGTEAFSLRSAAKEVGVDPAAVYRHYADREALLRAVASSAMDRLADAMQDRIAAAIERWPDDAAARFMAVGEAYVRFALAEPQVFRLAFGPHTVPGDDDPPSRGTALLHRTLAAILPPGTDVASGADGAVVMAWATVHGLAVLILDRRVRYDPDVVIPAVLRRAVAAVQHRPPRPSSPKSSSP